MAQQQNLINVRNYIAHHRWDIPPPDKSGTTWLELLASFESLGYRLERPIQTRAATLKALPILALKAKVDLLKKLVQYVAKNCLSATDQQYFASTQAPTTRLDGLAIMQNCRAMRAMPVVSADHGADITKAIIAGKGKHVTANMLH